MKRVELFVIFCIGFLSIFSLFVPSVQAAAWPACNGCGFVGFTCNPAPSCSRTDCPCSCTGTCNGVGQCTGSCCDASHSQAICHGCGCTPNTSGGSCNACPTNTPPPTPPPTPIPTTPPTGCTYQAKQCSGDDLLICNSSFVWELDFNCQYDVNGSANGHPKCNSSKIPNDCYPAPGEYCENDCLGNLCSSGQYQIICKDSNGNTLPAYAPPNPPICLPAPVCYTCHPIWDTCGGTVDCSSLPGTVSHIDSCSHVGCGPPCTTPTPGPGTPTATPTPIPTPTPVPGTIQARAMQVNSSDTSCAAVRASPTGISGTIFSFTPSSASHPSPQTQSGSSYVAFNSVIPGVYTISSQAPVQYQLARVCWADSVAGTSGEEFSHTLAPAGTLTWDLGYTVGSAWSQVQGGDVYASASLQSFVPLLASPRAFILDGAGGSTSFAGTGGTITTSGGYTIHTFTSSGTFTANSSGTIEYLLVGGGGGGGNTVTFNTDYGGGGGGGGGVLTGSKTYSVGETTAITIGAGGGSHTSGGNTVFGTIATAIGGGYGGAVLGVAGSGGSGGGATYNHASGGAGTTGQGYAGGAATVGNPGGGGGGAGGVGGNGVTTPAGAGGPGFTSSISGAAITYAGGGGGGNWGAGGPGGSGGGGAGGDTAAGKNATGYGSGGGGALATNAAGGSGSSGIVIIRYPTTTTTTGGYPGVAMYGQSYNFDSSGLTHGQAWVSSKNWLVNDTTPATDYYQLMYQRFGGAPATADYVNPTSPIAQPASRATPYYVTGDMTTSGNWTVNAGQTIVFFVNGNLTIGGSMNITGNGFVSFIVNGNITVDPSVGEVDGIYITSPFGTFSTGAGAVRFVGKGMFVAGNVLLQRDLGDAGNPTTSSELFIYNPQLLLTMPDQMKQLSVSWQEVAP